MDRFLSTDVIAGISVALLALYIGVALYGILAPVDHQDPQRGQAVGCLTIVIIALGAIEVLLLLAWRYHWPKVVRGFAVVALCPAFSFILSGAAQLVRRAASAYRKD